MTLALALLALLLAGPAPVFGAAGSGTIRVAILAEAQRADLRGTDIDVSEIGPCDGCPRRFRLDVVRAAVTARGVDVDGRIAAGFRLRSNRSIRLNGREYVGDLQLVKTGDTLAVVNELPLEDYLVGVLLAETGDRWPAEALRAQAIVARTYAAYQRQQSAGRPYHILASTAHQGFFGRVPASSPAWDAVRETTGLVLRWEGQLFPAFYHAESGGYTEDPRTVFAARNIPALKPVRCEFSVGSPRYYWNLDLRLMDLTEILRRNGVDVGTVVGIEVSERTASLRATSVTVQGARATARLRGEDLRRMIGYDVLRSTLFAVAVDRDHAHFSGRGWGHGVGLCQWGAKGMAERGYHAKQILEHYYPGATFGWLD